MVRARAIILTRLVRVESLLRARATPSAAATRRAGTLQRRATSDGRVHRAADTRGFSGLAKILRELRRAANALKRAVDSA
jgi:hypothetical protein